MGGQGEEENAAGSTTESHEKGFHSKTASSRHQYPPVTQVACFGGLCHTGEK